MTIVNERIIFIGARRQLVTTECLECGCIVERRETFTKEDLYAKCYGADVQPAETEIEFLMCGGVDHE